MLTRRQIRRNARLGTLGMLANMLAVRPAFWNPSYFADIQLARAALRRGAQQKLTELAPLISLLRAQPPETVLEIGTRRGGTLYAWCQLAHPRATIISADLPGGPFGGLHDEDHVPVLRSYARPSQSLYLLRADSHAAETRREVEAILSGRGLDFLLIDGDHSYAGVRKDFDDYSPLVSDGGVIALHDILAQDWMPDCEVDVFWNELRGRFRHREFVDPGRDSVVWGGFGIVHKAAA